MLFHSTVREITSNLGQDFVMLQINELEHLKLARIGLEGPSGHIGTCLDWPRVDATRRSFSGSDLILELFGVLC